MSGDQRPNHLCLFSAVTTSTQAFSLRSRCLKHGPEGLACSMFWEDPSVGNMFGGYLASGGAGIENYSPRTMLTADSDSRREVGRHSTSIRKQVYFNLAMPLKQTPWYALLCGQFTLAQIQSHARTPRKLNYKQAISKCHKHVKSQRTPNRSSRLSDYAHRHGCSSASQSHLR